MRRHAVVRVSAACAVVALCCGGGVARADDDSAALYASATGALGEGRAGDAVASLEALADRGVVDPVLSFDRGLAYAMRVRIGAEAPGDLGRAAHGFEEARDLTRDAKLAGEASRGLLVVRSEIARRRMRAGEPVEVDAGRSLARTLAGLLAEDTWAWLASGASALLAVALATRRFARAARMRIAGGVTAAVAGVALAISLTMGIAARRDRSSLREAVVVSAGARPVDERGLALPGGNPLPEAARVEVIEDHVTWKRVRFGSNDVRLHSSALRELARPD
jgi:hypothetical protein